MGRFKRNQQTPETETSIQIKLFDYLEKRGHKYILPNIFMFSWEIDLMSVTATGYVNEFEIKISRGDFFAEFEKRKKPIYINRLVRGMHTSNDNRRRHWGPNYFWFAVPKGLVSVDDVPDYAGLVEINGTPEIIKRPSLFHKEKVNARQMNQMLRSAMFKIRNLKEKVQNVTI